MIACYCDVHSEKGLGYSQRIRSLSDSILSVEKISYVFGSGSGFLFGFGTIFFVYHNHNYLKTMLYLLMDEHMKIK